MDNYSRRYHLYCERLEQQGLDGFVSTHPANLFYLFNFSGSTGVALTLNGTTRLLVDSRYIEQAQAEVVNCRPELRSGPLLPSLCDYLAGSARIGFESQHLTQADFAQLLRVAPASRWIPQTGLVEELRQIKDPSEIQLLQENFSRVQEALLAAAGGLRREMCELEFAGLLEFEMRKVGAEGFAFETIVASGTRASLPHGRASGKVIGEDPLLVDFGLKRQGYCTDLTRMFTQDAAVQEITQIVWEARQAAFSSVRPGLTTGQIDAQARQVISKAGYGDNFGHSLGHGLGLEVHELPRIAPNQQALLEEGMVFTLEPGIYLPGRFGVRIEDVVVVTRTGAHWLSDPER